MEDLDDDILKVAANVFKKHRFDRTATANNTNGGEGRITGGFDYTNSSTAASENAWRKKNNIEFADNEKERIRTKKLRARFVRDVKEVGAEVT